MTDNHGALADQQRDFRQALDDHLAATEAGLRALPGVGADHVQSVISAVRTRHVRMLQCFDEEMLAPQL